MSNRPKQRTQLDEDADALRILTREAHEVLKDLKTTIREANQARDELSTLVADSIAAGINDAVTTGLETYNKSIMVAIENAQAAVFDRFDVIAATLLGETESDRRKGAPSMLDHARLVRRIIEGSDLDDLTPDEKEYLIGLSSGRKR